MNYYFLITLVLLYAYLIRVYIKYGMTHSISATQPAAPDYEKGLFGTVWTAYVAPFIFYAPNDWFRWAIVALIIVATNPNYWDKKGVQDDLHYIGSYAVIILGFAGLIRLQPFWGAVITLIYAIFILLVKSGIGVFKKIKNPIYWFELLVATVISTFLSICL